MLKNLTAMGVATFVVAMIILILFAAYEVAVVFLKLPKDDTMAGFLNNLVMLVAGYYLGSSAGSKSKEATLSSQLPAAGPIPAPQGSQGGHTAALAVLGVLLAASLLVGSGDVWAAQGHVIVKHHKYVGLNCGWPHPDPGCSVNPTPVPPAPPPDNQNCDPASITCVVGGIANLQQDLVAAFQQTLIEQAAIQNAATGESWDPSVVQCLSGTPAQGTVGQLGYVAPKAGLITWLAGLNFPVILTSRVPPLQTDSNAFTVLEHGRLIAMAAEADVNVAVSNLSQGISANGWGKDVVDPCQAAVQSIFVTVPQNAVQETALIGRLIALQFPKAFAMKAKRLKAEERP